MEHRWGTRHPFNLIVRLEAGAHLLAFARLRNASSSGAYVEVCAAPPLMARVHLELGSEGHRSTEAHRTAAYVVRNDGAGIGLEWCDFAPSPILALIESRAMRVRPERRTNAETPPALYLPAYGEHWPAESLH